MTAIVYALFAFVAGLVFGIGLLFSQMASPAKVLGFLDLAGRWDPSLAFVMVGAVCVAVIGFVLAGRRPTTLLGTPFFLPIAGEIDMRLVGGGLIFGIGWGLGGFCPGPGLVALGAGQAKAFVFVAAMLAGMLAFEGIEAARARSVTRAAQTDAPASE